jgi:hypothetical protein
VVKRLLKVSQQIGVRGCLCAALGACLALTLAKGASDRTSPVPGGQSPAESKPQPAVPWLVGTTDEKFAQIERHLRGLDVAMAEIGYRYGELLIAAKGRNWEYALYQAEKIDLSLRLALERRPKRAKSSQPFLAEDLPRVLTAVKKRDGEQLDQAMIRLHDGCVQCHKSENVLHFKEATDRIRQRSLLIQPHNP